MLPATRQGYAWMIPPVLPVSASIATPRVLRIDRYRLKPGTAVAVHHLQQQIAIAVARATGAWPSLAVESLTGPSEVWRISGFPSVPEQRKALQAAEDNPILRAELERIETQLRVLIGDPVTTVATYCGGVGRRFSWPMGRGHYLIITRLDTHENSEGALYETADGSLLRFASARTRKSADLRAHGPSPGNVFSIRPTWSVPAPAWIRSDPAFWNSSPVAKLGNVTCLPDGPR